ncbi:hypothetical protein [Goodfellowiella coeruleoviolacea]|uniref:Uncharacterized protein n=1 Tax=Goodfellowiella coeruleoviolacea TaxID=334858 RepID=A0AAE3GBJ8_9PSEU|nr:hypothetical protein [Goodfellowiella coeruleoviolacea]MCP2164069.1 hypothetical protein [Goodfellowiella coeruleoviolacea]
MVLVAAVTSACAGPETASDQPAAQPGAGMGVRVLVRDMNLRPEGVDCAGAGPYLYLHRSAPFEVRDGGGAALARGELPSGTSVRALPEDLGVDRIPTFCQFTFSVTVPDRTGYQLVVDDAAPIDLAVNRDDPASPILVGVIP